MSCFNQSGNMNPGAAATQQQYEQQPFTANKAASNYTAPKITETVDSKSSLFPEINKMKISGNERFKAGDMDKAASLYLEVC